jgi:hypothetical protein
MRRSAVRSIVLSFLIVATAVLLNPSPARADGAKKEFAGYTKYVWYHAHYDINPDGTHVETQAWALKQIQDQRRNEPARTGGYVPPVAVRKCWEYRKC